jgi:hypothetical protein
MSDSPHPALVNVAASPKSRRRKWFFRVIWAMFALVVGVSLFWTWSYYSALAKRDALIAELHAKGDPVWWDEVVARLLKEESKDTGTEYYLKAIWALGGDYNPAGPKLPNGVLWNAIDLQPPVVPEQPTIDATVQQQLTLAKPVFDFLEQAVRRKPGLLSANTNRRKLKGSDPYTFVLPHIQDSRALLRMNFWRVYDALARHADAEAYHSTWVGLAASEQLSNEPWIVAQFVRFAMQILACRQLLMCLEYAAVPEVEFQRIDAFFASLEDSFRLEAIMQADRALGLHLWSSGNVTKEVIKSSALIRRSSNPFQDGLARGWLAILGSPLVAPSRVETQVQELRFYSRIEGMVDRPHVDLKAFEDSVAEYEALAPIYGLIEVPAGKSKSALMFARYVIVAHRRLILHRLALRLRRHYDRRGRFPERLDELCDESMPKIRLEWFQNHPIAYSPSADGFRLEVPEAVRHDLDRSVEVKLRTLR